MIRIVLAISAALALAGCATVPSGPTSVAGSECKILERPDYEVRGATPYDQRWVDRTVAGGIGACNWAYPAPRPPELEKQKAPPVVAKRAQPRRSLIRRIKDRVIPAAEAKQVTWPPPAVAVLPAPPTPPPPREAIDELLYPGGKR
ncbi:hypothetical protein OOZ54_12970 [Rhodopseudomonas palustris]|uniref:hypothetical protein n=1 Tax=Rhodopseudomonas palustris TaxID=1076 RepID=UPI0022F10047|nr:hypothetical protein [Rhodopseudomonas palustris]WBU27607.1 hypothetical protein OOZ54_12970 [Rhodopseudomonas palustris]